MASLACMAYLARMIWAIRRRFQIDHAAIPNGPANSNG